MAGFYSARGWIIPPLPWPTFAPPLSRKDVAKRFGVHPEDVSRVLPLAFLSPRIVEAILTGQQPADLSVRHLARNIELPIRWEDQGKLLGI